MPTYKVQLKRECLKDLRSGEDFIVAIQLSRIVNALRANLRAQICICHDDRLLKAKDRLDLMLCQASMLYEGMKVFSQLSGKLSPLEWWKGHPEEIRTLQKEHNDKASFTNSVVKHLRHQVFFHFDSAIISEMIKHHPFEGDINFMIGQSTARKDVVYTLADDLILSYLISLSTESIDNPLDKYTAIEEKILRLSDLMSSVFDNLIKELLADKLLFIKEA